MKFRYSYHIGSLFFGLSISLVPLAGQTGLSAGTAPEATLEKVLLLTQEHNPELRSLEQKYEAAKHRIPQISSLPDPKLQVMHFVESVQTRTGPQENVISLSQTVPWFGTLKKREAMASAEAEAVWFGYQSRELQVLREVALEYYDYAYLERAVELTGKNLQLLEQLGSVVEERVRAGGDLNALLRLKVETARLASHKASLEQEVSASKANLLAKVGLKEQELPGRPYIEIPPPVSLDTASLVKSLEMRNPELEAIARQEKSARARVELARLGNYPDFTIGLNYIQLGEAANSSVPDSGKDPWGLTVSVNLPIFRDKHRSEKSEALSLARSLGNAWENRKNLLVGNLLSALSRLEDAQRRVELYGGELLPLAEQALQISQTGYENDRVGILEVIDSERTLLQLQLENWKAAVEALKSRIVVRTLAEPVLVKPITKE